MPDDQLQRSLESIHEKLDALTNDTSLIKRAVFGEEQTDNSGLIKRVNRLEKNDDATQKLLIQGRAVVAVYGTGFAGTLWLLWENIKGFFKH